MPTLPSKLRTLARLKARKPAKPQGPPGWGGGWQGGPVWQDPFYSRRAPTPAELVESFKGLLWACSSLNQSAVARQRFGLYVKTGGGQVRPKSHSCPVRPLRPAVKAMRRGGGNWPSKSAQWFQKSAGAAEVDEVTDHPLLEMTRSVNRDFDWDLLVRYVVACYDVVGWFLLWPESTSPINGKAVPDLLWPLVAQHVTPLRGSAGSLVREFQYFGATYEPEALIRSRGVSLRDPYGMGYGPAQAASVYVGLNDRFTAIQESMLDQGGKISGYVTDGDPANPMGRKEADKYEAKVNARWTRANAGRIPYIPGSIKLVPTVWPPADIGALNISEWAMKLIANCLGVPLSLLKTEDVNRANADAGHLQHARLAVDPRCQMIAGAFTRWTHLHAEANGLDGWDRLFWAFDNPVLDDREQQSKIFTAYIDKGVMCPNEVRHELGFDDYDGGGEFLRPGTLKSVDQIMNPPEPAAAPGAPGAAVPGTEPDEFDAETDAAPEGEKRLPFPVRFVG